MIWKLVDGEDLPDDDSDVLGFWPKRYDNMGLHGFIWPVHYYNGHWTECDGDTTDIVERPAYWMPMPSKPNGE